MSKAYVWNLRRPVLEERTVVLSDPENNPDFRAELRVRRHDAMSQIQCLADAETYVAQFVGRDGERPLVTLPPVGNEALTVTERAAHVICIVLNAQVQDERYTFEEFAAMCVSPVISAQIARLALELGAKETGALEADTNPIGGPTGPQSGSRSVGSETTQRSSHGQTPSCEVSTTVSEPLAATTASE